MESIGKAAFVAGAVGFATGFFGPMLFFPSANQGPLVGIFFTGPAGFVAGAVFGAVVVRSKWSRSTAARRGALIGLLLTSFLFDRAQIGASVFLMTGSAIALASSGWVSAKR